MRNSYQSEILKLLDLVVKVNKTSLPKAVQLFANAIMENKIVHTFGTGHSHIIGLELFARAGGLANVNAMLDSSLIAIEGARRSAKMERISGLASVIWEQHTINEGDIFLIISNSGRNAMPNEMALLAKNAGHKVIAITSIEQSKKYPSRIKGLPKLYEIADIVLDNCAPTGDGILTVGGKLVGAASTLTGCFLANQVSTDAMIIAESNGCILPIYSSQNIDGHNNEDLYAEFENRIKHL